MIFYGPVKGLLLNYYGPIKADLEFSALLHWIVTQNFQLIHESLLMKSVLIANLVTSLRNGSS